MSLADTHPLMRLSKRFWAAQLAIWGMYWVVSALVVRLLPPFRGHPDVWGDLALVAFLDALLYLVTSTGMQLSMNQLPLSVSGGRVARRALRVWVVGSTISFSFGALLSYLLMPKNSAFEAEATSLLPNWVIIIDSFVSQFLILGGWMALVLGVRAWKQQALLTATQLDVLRYQLNPHFLFNTLNSLRGLIAESPPRAELMVQHLADFLRSTLTPSKEGVLPLSNELELTRNYLAIQKIRFEENLEVTYAIDPRTEHILVPTLLLNPLVENAVKFGQNTSPSPLRLRITTSLEPTGVRIQVSNSGRLVPVDASRSHVGLRNVRDRLELLIPGGSSVKLEEVDGWVHATMWFSPPEAR